MRPTAVLLLLIIACHTSRPASRALPKTTPYLVLFEQGRTWTLPSQGGNVTCRVAETKQVGDASVSRLDCGALLASGTWVSTPAGLYHPYLPVDDPDELTLLGEDDLLITRAPRDRDHSRALQGAQEAIEAFGFEGSWCVRQSTQSQAEKREWVLCFDGANITGGGEDVVSDGQHHRVSFGNAPPDTTDQDN